MWIRQKLPLNVFISTSLPFLGGKPVKGSKIAPRRTWQNKSRPYANSQNKEKKIIILNFDSFFHILSFLSFNLIPTSGLKSSAAVSVYEKAHWLHQLKCVVFFCCLCFSVTLQRDTRSSRQRKIIYRFITLPSLNYPPGEEEGGEAAEGVAEEVETVEEAVAETVAEVAEEVVEAAEAVAEAAQEVEAAAQEVAAVAEAVEEAAEAVVTTEEPAPPVAAEEPESNGTTEEEAAASEA